MADALSKALREAEVQLLEPYTNMVVAVPEEYLGAVLSDLTSQRRGQVREVASLRDSREITAFTPLSCLMVRLGVYRSFIPSHEVTAVCVIMLLWVHKHRLVYNSYSRHPSPLDWTFIPVIFTAVHVYCTH